MVDVREQRVALGEERLRALEWIVASGGVTLARQVFDQRGHRDFSGTSARADSTRDSVALPPRERRRHGRRRPSERSPFPMGRRKTCSVLWTLTDAPTFGAGPSRCCALRRV